MSEERTSDEDAVKRRFEFEYLRAEIEHNKRFVLERPLVIAGVPLVAMLIDPEVASPSPLAFLAILGLLVSQWMTDNRLSSSGRIIAYLMLVHERPGKPRLWPPLSFTWEGWENSLARYRAWIGDERTKMPPNGGAIIATQLDKLGFASPIRLLHAILAVVIFAMSLERAEAGSLLDVRAGWWLWSSALTGAISLTYAVLALMPDRLPDRLRRFLPREIDQYVADWIAMEESRQRAERDLEVATVVAQDG